MMISSLSWGTRHLDLVDTWLVVPGMCRNYSSKSGNVYTWPLVDRSFVGVDSDLLDSHDL